MLAENGLCAEGEDAGEDEGNVIADSFRLIISIMRLWRKAALVFPGVDMSRGCGLPG